MPTVITQGAASAKGYGFGASSAAANYIEDVFSTYLYTGNGSTQTITNGIDLSGKGGLVWTKGRSQVANNKLVDTARGATKVIISNAADEQATDSLGLTSFSTTGYSLSTDSEYNSNGQTYASWSFRKQPKFFDVVTYTGNGASGRTVPHNLGSAPGCIMVKCLSHGFDWRVYHRSLGATFESILNSTASPTTNSSTWNNTEPTSTQFTVGNLANVNFNGGTFVAYLFAHDAGGFGLAGTDNVISCGMFTYSAGTTVNLGYEPQWIIWKNASTLSDWFMPDIMRGWTTDGNAQWLEANTADAENASAQMGIAPTSTGFRVPTGFGNSQTYIYIAIRRGPMKTPTTGTSVFVPYAYNGSGAGEYTTGINQDLFYQKSKGSSSYVWSWYDRLRGPNLRLQSNATNPESSTSGVSAFNNQSMTFAAADGFSSASPWGGPYIGYAFRRAPGFFDVVCYTGTGANRTVSHNLGVVPELMINKKRSGAENWFVYSSATGNTKFLQLQATDNAQTDSTYWNNTSPTSSVFTVGTGSTNDNAATYVTYLFATVAGVSKVGSYTGIGAGFTLTINCGFTSGARFVLIKRTDSTGDWYVWDSARGISSGNDPYLLLNSTAAEVTGTNYVDTTSIGFQVTSAASTTVNVSGGSYIFLAIA